MRARIMTGTLGLLCLGILSGCQPDGPTATASDDFSPALSHKPGHGGKGGGGGGAGPVAVESGTMTGGIGATDRDGGSEFAMEYIDGSSASARQLFIGDGGASNPVASDPIIDFTFSVDASQCVLVNPDPTLSLTKDDYVNLLKGLGPPAGSALLDTPTDLLMRIDDRFNLPKASKKNYLQAWVYDDAGRWWMVRLLPAGRDAAAGSGNPLVSAQDVSPGDGRTWTEFTFEHGNGRIVSTTRGFQEHVDCPYLEADEISITVIEG